MFFRLRFDLPDVGPCGGGIDGGFCYVMDFMSDNQVFQIYVNGQSQIINPSSNYGNTGFFYNNRAFIELCSDWQNGSNELIVHIKSGTSLAGFLAQARIPDVPDDSTTPICISTNEITVTLEAPDFQVQLSPTDLDAGSYSLCNGVDLSAENISFSCADIGENTSTLIVQASVNNQFQSTCTTTVNVIEGSELCPDCPQDISNSLIPNPDFEDGTCDPTDIARDNNQETNGLACADSWNQATNATSDYFDLITFPDRSLRQGFNGTAGMVNPSPPNGSDHFVGSWRNSLRLEDDPIMPGIQEQEYIEYVGANLSSPIIEDTSVSYTHLTLPTKA